MTLKGRKIPMTCQKRFHGKALLLFICTFLTACGGGQKAANLGVQNSLLSPCPASPNCVSSDATDADHQIPAFQLTTSPAEAWSFVRQRVSELPKTKIITETADYLHAECRSAVFGFVDDLELYLRPEQGLIAVRSAARLGYSDFGVNRRRVDDLRDELRKGGVTK